MTELVAAGVELMLVGMGIVYAFLVMLIGAIKVMSYCVLRFFPEQPISAETPTFNVIDQKSVAAITAAVHQYRQKQK